MTASFQGSLKISNHRRIRINVNTAIATMQPGCGCCFGFTPYSPKELGTLEAGGTY